MKLVLSVLAIAVLGGTLFAKESRSPELIYQKKCAMCHTVGKPTTKSQKQKMVAPPITVAMKGAVVTIDAVDGPFKDDELREEFIAFIKDCLYYPTADKTNCEDMVVKKFGRMPSLKGFISKDELDIVAPWIFDTYKPLKVNGEYQK